MIEDFASRAWAEHHKALGRNVADIAHAVAGAFERLNARQYDAPWKREATHSEPRCG